MQEISLNILDIAQNAIKAGAKNIRVALEYNDAILNVRITDDGCGMTEEQLKRVTDPFYTTRRTRSVGLGIPFFKMAAELTGGSFEITSAVGRGTAVSALFDTSHIDCMPLGNIAETIAQLISLNGDINITFLFERAGEGFSVSTDKIKTHLGDVPVSAPEVMVFIREYIALNISDGGRHA